MFKLLLLAIIIYSFWNPLVASTIFITIIGLFEIWIILAQWQGKNIVPKDDKWSFQEFETIKKYYTFFRYPFAAKIFSATLSMIQLSVFIWVPWLIYRNLWIPAILIGINYFIAGTLAVKLNPRHFLHDAVEKQNGTQYLSEMLMVDTIIEKMWNIDLKNGEVKIKNSEKRSCVNCGKEINENQKFCKYCGKQIK